MKDPHRTFFRIHPMDSLQLLLVILKLTGKIDWSWLLILSPLIVGCAIIILGIIYMIVTKNKKEKTVSESEANVQKLKEMLDL